MKAVDRGEIGEVTLGSGEKIKGETAAGEAFTTDNPRSEDFKEMLLEKGVAVKEGGAGAQVSANLITGGILIGGMFLILRSRNKKTVSAIEAKNVAEAAPAQPVTFQDVAGNEEAKRSMEELVEFLRDPAKFQRYGARMPRGVLFYGPPGTGKTLMARALAGEAGVAFYALSGSDFVQMYVGVGASRVRELFKKARGHGKCVIFIDEIDALGKKRQAGGDGGSDERDQTLNALLSEMSGFKGDEGIVVVAATNRADTLDEALLRPGRFDRHIEIGLPDLAARRRILQHYLEGKPVEDVDVDALARRCVYFSGAKLEYLVNEAAIAAAKRGGGRIAMADLDQAYYRVLTGFEKLERDQIPLQDRRVTAVHEAGHALVTKLISPGEDGASGEHHPVHRRHGRLQPSDSAGAGPAAPGGPGASDADSARRTGGGGAGLRRGRGDRRRGERSSRGLPPGRGLSGPAGHGGQSGLPGGQSAAGRGHGGAARGPVPPGRRAAP